MLYIYERHIRVLCPNKTGLNFYSLLSSSFFMHVCRLTDPCNRHKKGGRLFFKTPCSLHGRPENKNLSGLESKKKKMPTGLKCLIVGQQAVHTDVCPSTPIETSLCGARPLEAIQPICIRCLWDYTALIHPLHPSLTLPLPPASPPSPHLYPPTSSSPSPPCWQHLPVINDNPSPPLATVWKHLIGEVMGAGGHSLFLFSQQCLLLNWLRLTEEKDTGGSWDKRHFGEEGVSLHCLLLIAPF